MTLFADLAREFRRVIQGSSEEHSKFRRRLATTLLVTLVIDAIGTTLVYFLEHDANGSEVHSVFQAFFFTTVQLLTVSSQIPNPLTTGGRIVDIVLELWAVIVVAGSAGAIASFFSAADPGV